MAGPLLMRNAVRRSIIAAAALAVVGGLLFLAQSVVEDLGNLASAQSDNQQWTITQAEVEFLEFANALADITADKTLPVSDMRRRFDVFYSRVTTLERASIYQVLKGDPDYADSLAALRDFLDEAASIIDLPDQDLRLQLPTLAAMTEETRPDARLLERS